MSAYGREFHIASMRKSSSFEDVGHGSRERRRQIKSHTCSICDVSGVHYPAERWLQGRLEEWERLRAVELHESTCCYREYPQFVANWIFHVTKSHTNP
ncbi:hypothetical protein TNCV_1194641 [Trichonephila clavipes]|nr:hypothetical protein TNCV_1194641 [Trichonephila clavipes]